MGKVSAPLSEHQADEFAREIRDAAVVLSGAASALGHSQLTSIVVSAAAAGGFAAVLANEVTDLGTVSPNHDYQSQTIQMSLGLDISVHAFRRDPVTATAAPWLIGVRDLARSFDALRRAVGKLAYAREQKRASSVAGVAAYVDRSLLAIERVEGCTEPLASGLAHGVASSHGGARPTVGPANGDRRYPISEEALAWLYTSRIRIERIESNPLLSEPVDADTFAALFRITQTTNAIGDCLHPWRSHLVARRIAADP